MIDERSHHQCHKARCDSQAVYTTKFSFDVAGPGVRYPIRTMCSIKVCEQHKSEQDVRAYLLSDHNREQIIAAVTEQGHPEPDFFTAKIIFERIEPEMLTILALSAVICDRDECRKSARWQVKQRFRMMWQRGKGVPQVEVLTNICVCDEHKALTRAADFLDKESKSGTLAWLNSRGVLMPDFKTMEIAFVPLHDGKRIDPRLFVGDNGPVDQFKIQTKGAMS